ncbi:MAG TPA: inositol monophosphatase [Tepidisphaeraceae bacterium]|jgi:myo-inositol-1(or 4)-monophosphatase|nr:inositol monophosphatase [Tepidisphaeraceae bacterium]
MSLSNDLSYIVELARGAGSVALSHYGKVDRLTKTHATTTDEAVTVADRATQRYIVDGLRQRFPTDGIIGEESDAGDAITAIIPNPAGRNWVIDPIDGTNNFIAGLGAFAVCIGLMDAGRPVLGVVYDVTRDEMYAGIVDEGATLNGHPIRATERRLDDAAMIMVTSNLIDKAGRCPQWACNFIGQTTWKTRMLGSAAIEAIQVAAGVAHAAITVNGKLWDAVAPCAIVLAAGGVVTGLDGKPIWPYDLTAYTGAKVPFLAGAPNAHGDVLEYLLKNP